MVKKVKPIISILICICITLTLTMPSFAYKGKTAFIVVSGMNTFPLCEDDKSIFPPESDAITSMATKLVIPTVKFLNNKDYEKFGDSAFPALNSMFGPLSCDKDGNSVYNITTKLFPNSVESSQDLFIGATKDEFASVRAGIDAFGAENTYFFNYDWREDPFLHADKLNEMIKSIKNTGSYDRIALVAYSMGGTVTCSYLYKYGSKDIDSIALCATAFQGTSCVGSLFTGDLSIGMDGLLRRIAQLTRDNTYENIINYINELLTLNGINAKLEDFVNGITDTLKDRIYDEFIIPDFGYMPGLWALVDKANYEQAKEYMLRSNDSTMLRERIDEYHYNVQDKAQELLNNAKADTDIYIIAQYNMQGLPISVTSDESNNDYLIDTCYASGGAICSKRGDTLGKDYVQAKHSEHNYMSADNQIDASTCMFPETTWFIRDMGHVDFPYGDSTDFIIWLSSESGHTVFENDKYTQFMTYSYGNNSLTPVTENNPAKTVSDIFFSYLSMITTWIFNLLTNIFKV